MPSCWRLGTERITDQAGCEGRTCGARASAPRLAARSRRVGGWRLASVLCGLLAVTAYAADAPQSPGPAGPLSDNYGFGPLEVFKLEFRSHSMVPGDFNGDGRTDLAVVDNSHSRIDLLLQRVTPPDETTVATSEDVNRIDSHWRFEHSRLPVDREVDALIAGDFNHDGKTDLAYFGKPDRLVVRYQTDGSDWSSQWETRLADVEASGWSLVCGDFNHDGRGDLVVLGKQSTYVLLQLPTGGMGPAIPIRNTAEELRLGMSGDFDGDGRDDLFYTATSDGERYICVRLQTAEGRLGPEYRLELKNSLGVTVSDVLGDGTKEILAISGLTKRLGMYRVHRPAAGETMESRPILYGVGVKGSGKRDLRTGDLDGDGLVDVVVSDPESAQLIVYRQKRGSGLDLGTAYSSFLGVEQLRVYDLNRDGKAEVIVFSPKEKTLGICGLDQDGDRLTFPQTLPVDEGIVAFEIADLNADSIPEVVYVSRERGSGSSSKFLLKALSYTQDGQTKPYVFGEDKSEVEIDTKDVSQLTVVDADGDGRPDLLVTLGSSRPPILLLTDERGVPKQVPAAGGLQIPELEAGAIFSGNLDGPALLIAQGAFARRMKYERDRGWQVLDQYNAGESNSKVKGVAALNLDDKPGPELVLVDTGASKLRMLRLEGELYKPWRAVDIGAFPYQSLQVADLNGDGREDLLLFGGGRFAVLYTGQTDPRLEELATFESPRKDSLLVDVAAGDLNGDGHADLAVLDNQTHAIDIVSVQPGPKLVQALSFKVFEEKSFHGGSRGAGLEPREMLIVDVTGDGLADLLLLTHDRILLYPQDSTAAPAAVTSSQGQQPAESR